MHTPYAPNLHRLLRRDDRGESMDQRRPLIPLHPSTDDWEKNQMGPAALARAAYDNRFKTHVRRPPCRRPRSPLSGELFVRHLPVLFGTRARKAVAHGARLEADGMVAK